MNKTGDYFLTKLKSSGARTFYHFDRCTFIPSSRLSKLFLCLWCLDTPGPGSYRLPSDFGFYEAKRKFMPSASQPNLHT